MRLLYVQEFPLDKHKDFMWPVKCISKFQYVGVAQKHNYQDFLNTFRKCEQSSQTTCICKGGNTEMSNDGADGWPGSSKYFEHLFQESIFPKIKVHCKTIGEQPLGSALTQRRGGFRPKTTSSTEKCNQLTEGLF